MQPMHKAACVTRPAVRYKSSIASSPRKAASPVRPMPSRTCRTALTWLLWRDTHASHVHAELPSRRHALRPAASTRPAALSDTRPAHHVTVLALEQATVSCAGRNVPSRAPQAAHTKPRAATTPPCVPRAQPARRRLASRRQAHGRRVATCARGRAGVGQTGSTCATHI